MRKFSGNAFLTYGEYEKILKNLKGEYPFLNVCTCGKTLLGKNIYSVVFGKGKEKILYAGGTHGTEWLTSLLLIRFLEKLSHMFKTDGFISGYSVCELYSKYTLVIVPEINPDGIEISIKGKTACGKYDELCENACAGNFGIWNANARGVDINHNFNAGWQKLKEIERKEGIVSPSYSKYGGTFPESEPETVAMTSLCRNLDIKKLISFHSQGEEIYWEYGENMPGNSILQAKIFAAVSEYTLVKNDGTASHGGFKDWFIDEIGKPAFTVEIGSGKNPLPLSQLDEIYRRLEDLLILGIIL